MRIKHSKYGHYKMNDKFLIPAVGITWVFVIITTLFVSCQQPSGIDNSPDGNLKEQIIRTGVIRAAYAIYPPASIKDPNTGELSGIFIDVLEEVAKNLGGGTPQNFIIS